MEKQKIRHKLNLHFYNKLQHIGNKFLDSNVFFNLFRNAKCLFTLSTGRTGTSTLIKLLNLSDQINAYHEPSPLLGELLKSAYFSEKGTTSNIGIEFIKTRRIRILKSHLSQKIYAEHGLVPPISVEINRLLPNSKFIHIHRHPGEVIRSGMSRGWYNNHPWDIFRVEPNPNDPDRLSWERDWRAFEKICWFWKTVNQSIITANENELKGKIFNLPFKSLIDIDEKTINSLSNFIGISPISLEAAKKITLSPINQQNSLSFPHHNEWEPKQKEKLLEIAGDIMEKLDYQL